MSEIDCRSCRDALGDFLDEELGPERREVIQGHLDACEPCRTELARMSETDDVLTNGLGSIASSAPPLVGLMEGLRERLGADVKTATMPSLRPALPGPIARVPPWARRIPNLRPGTGLFHGDQLQATLHTFTSIARLLKVGRPLTVAISLLAAQEQEVSGVWKRIRTSVSGGYPFSTALREHPDVFPEYVCEAVAAGEESGRLGEVLEELSNVLRDRSETSQKVTGSLTYPFVVLGAICGIATFVAVTVMPKFAKIYAQHGAPLPYLTRLSLRVATTQAWIHELLFLAVSSIAIIGYLALRRGWFSTVLDGVRLWIPVFRQIHGQELLGWYCSLTAVLIRGGIPVPRAMRLAGWASPNRIFGAFTHEVAERVTSGMSLSEALSTSPVFPLDARHILTSGEEGNTLPESFEAVGVLYRTRLLRELQLALSVVEPVAIIVLGLILSAFIYSAYMPIFQMARTVSSH